MNDVSSILFHLTTLIAGDLVGKHGWPMCLAWNIILPVLWESGTAWESLLGRRP